MEVRIKAIKRGDHIHINFWIGNSPSPGKSGDLVVSEGLEWKMLYTVLNVGLNLWASIGTGTNAFSYQFEHGGFSRKEIRELMDSVDSVYNSELPFEKELELLINRQCAEQASNTPDFILAEYMMDCLQAYNKAICVRDKWYCIEPRPGEIKNSDLTPSNPFEC